MAFDAPPVPRMSAFLCHFLSSMGSMLCVKPMTSLLYPFRMVLFPSCLTRMTFTAPMALASGERESRNGITFSL